MTIAYLTEATVLFLGNATCFVYDDHEFTCCQSGGCYKHVLLSSGDLWSTPLVPMLEESALLSIILSGGLIACRFQTIHLGCNYVEELKTAFCHSSGVVTLHHMRCWHALVEVDAKGQCCMLASFSLWAFFCFELEGYWGRVMGRYVHGCMFLHMDLHDLSL